MKALEQQLAMFGDVLEREQDAVALDEVTKGSVLVATAPVRTGRRWVWALAAAAAVLIVVGLVPLLVNTAGDAEPASTPTTETPTTTVEPASTTVNALQAQWVKVDVDQGSQVSGFAGGPSLLTRDIGGYVLSSGKGRLLFSDDGTTWTTDAISPELAGYLAFRSQGEWAVAGNGMWQMSSSNTRDLLRSDGSQWVKVDLPGSDESTWPEFPVTFGGTTLVADEPDGFWVAASGEPFVYVEAPWAWPKGGIDPGQHMSIETAADGGFVATLTLYDIHPDDQDKEEGSFDGEVLVWMEIWTSMDGYNWQNQGTPSFLGTDEIDSGLYVLTVSHDGLMYLRIIKDGGINNGGYVADYVSSDAVDWQLVGRDLPGEPGMISVDDSTCWVQTADFGYFCRGHIEEDSSIRLLVSTGGQSWQELDQPPGTDGLDLMSAWVAGDIVFVRYGGDADNLWVGHLDLEAG